MNSIITQLDRDNKWLSWLTLFLFAVSFFQLLWISYFPKAMSVYPDELRYLHLADSLANHGSIWIHGSPSNFSKVLYPLILYPASFFSGMGYITAINIINSILMALLVPLCLLLARMCRLNGIHTSILLLMAVMIPDRMYAITFMSENLFLPLGIFVSIIAWKILEMEVNESHYTLCASLFGLLVYLAYLNKEVGVVFLLAYAGVLLYRCVSEPKLRRWKILMRMCAPFFAFGIIYVVVELTLFSGMQNVYAIQLIPRLGEWKDWISYLVHAYWINSTWILLAFFFFPVVLPLVCWKDLNESSRLRYLFLLFVMIFTVAIVTYTISLYEDYPSLAPRQHLRYISFLFLPVLAVFFHTLEAHQSEGRKYILRLAGFSLFFLLSLSFIEMPFSTGSHVDQIMLKYVGQEESFKEKCYIFVLFISLFILFLKRKRYFTIVFSCIVMAVCSWNMSLANETFLHEYAANRERIESVCMLSQKIEGKKTVYMDWETRGWLATGHECKILDTYCINQVGILTRDQLQVLSKLSKEYDTREFEILLDAKKWPLEITEQVRKEYYPDVKISPDMASTMWNEFCPNWQQVEYVMIEKRYENEVDMSTLNFVQQYGDILLYENIEPCHLFHSSTFFDDRIHISN